jgi:hypothetical protein
MLQCLRSISIKKYNMLEKSDSTGDTSTVLKELIVGVKNANIHVVVYNRDDSSGCGGGEEKKEREADENGSESSLSEISKLGDDINDMNMVYSSQDYIEEEDTMRQGKDLVEQKFKENEGKADRQMRKVQADIENLRKSLCEVRHDNGSELSREERLASENEFLAQVNEIMNLRLYRAVSMLEVEEDYSVELEAKIAKLEGKMKERDGVINRLSASAVASRSDKQMAKIKRETLTNIKRTGRDTYTELSDSDMFLQTSVMKTNGSKLVSDKKIKEKTQEPERNPKDSQIKGRQGRRGLFKKSDSLGDLNYVGGLELHGPLAMVLSGGDLEDHDSEGALNDSKVKGKSKRFDDKRSVSLGDLTAADGDLDDFHPFTPGKDGLDSASSHSTITSKKSKRKRKAKRGDNELDAASSHSTTSKNRKSKRKKDRLDSASSHSNSTTTKSKGKRKGRRSDFQSEKRAIDFDSLSSEESFAKFIEEDQNEEQEKRLSA